MTTHAVRAKLITKKKDGATPEELQPLPPEMIKKLSRAPPLAVPKRYFFSLALAIFQCIVCLPIVGIFAVTYASLAIRQRRDPDHNPNAKCGHRCFFYTGLLLSVLGLLIGVIVYASLSTMFYIRPTLFRTLTGYHMKIAEKVVGANQTLGDNGGLNVTAAETGV